MNGRADAGAASRTLVMMQWPWTLTMEEQAMRLEARHFYLATTGVCIFLAAQAFQALCIIFWLPEESMTAASDFAIRLGGLDRIRALAVLLGIVALAMTYGVIALDRFAQAPLTSLLGFAFGLLFIAFEVLHRGLDFVMVSQQWAGEFASAADPAVRDALAQRHELWESFTAALYFPLLLSGMVASTCFAIATWSSGRGWLWLASTGFALNALRILGRLLGSYTDIAWLGFMDSFILYLLLVFLANGMVAAWLIRRAALSESRSAPPTTPPRLIPTRQT